MEKLVATIVMLAEFFLLSLALGVGAFSFLADTKETGAGFIKVLAAICGVSLLIALILHLTYGAATDPLSLLYYLGTLCFVLTYFFHKDQKNVFTWLVYGVQNISLIVLLFLMNNTNQSQFLFGLTSIFFLGSVTYAMLMGHWYLVTPKLSEKPLKIALYFTWTFLLIKLAWTIFGYQESAAYFVNGTMKGGGYSFNWIMLIMRAGWGYGVLGVMSYFAYRLVSMRSIQSATGMLYAMTFFVFIAELISMYMFYDYGIFL